MRDLLVMSTYGVNTAWALTALRRARQCALSTFETYLVLDRPPLGWDDEDLVRLMDGWPVTVDVAPERRGLVGAYNRGLAYARGLLGGDHGTGRYDGVLFLEDHIQVSPGWDRKLRATGEAHPEFGWVSCLQIENARARFTAYASRWTAPAIEAIGELGFAPKHFDDGDAILRLRAAGFRPTAIPCYVSHPQGNTSPHEDDATYAKDHALLAEHHAAFTAKWGYADMPWELVETHPTVSCAACRGALRRLTTGMGGAA